MILHILPEVTSTLDSTTAIEEFRPSWPLMKMYFPLPSVTKYQKLLQINKTESIFLIFDRNNVFCIYKQSKICEMVVI